MITLGVRAHDFGKKPIKELAHQIAGKDFRVIQLALSKALSDFHADTGMQSPGMAHHIRNVLAEKGIRVGILGCYINVVNPDQSEIKKLFDRFKEHIRFARDYGCGIVATETGSMNADYSWNPDNHSEEAFKIFIERISELVEEAEKFGVIVGIEGVAQNVIHTPEKIKRVLDIVNSNHLQVVFDPVNLLSEENFTNQDRIMEKSFELFGDRIVAIHAKDFVIENGVLRSVPAGYGQLNYERLLSLVNARKPYIDVILEDNRVETMEHSIRHIRSLF